MLSDQPADYRPDDPYIQAQVHRPSPRSILQLDDSATVLQVEALAGSNHVTPTADRDGPALELCVGIRRVALPLSPARGSGAQD